MNRPDPSLLIATMAALELERIRGEERTLTVDLSALNGLMVHGTDRINPRCCRVVPEQGPPYDVPLDGRPLGLPGNPIRHVFMHRAVLDQARRQATKKAA